MRIFLSLLTALAFAGKLSAVDTNASAPQKIGAMDATNYYDQQVVVTGKVAQVTIRPNITYINLEKPYPDSPFAVVIFHQHSSFYGDANSLKGLSIEIKGKIKKYNGKPEVSLDKMEQLTVIGGWDPGTNAPAATPPADSKTPKSAPKTPPPAPAGQSTNLPEIM